MTRFRKMIHSYWVFQQVSSNIEKLLFSTVNFIRNMIDNWCTVPRKNVNTFHYLVHNTSKGNDGTNIFSIFRKKSNISAKNIFMKLYNSIFTLYQPTGNIDENLQRHVIWPFLRAWMVRIYYFLLNMNTFKHLLFLRAYIGMPKN